MHAAQPARGAAGVAASARARAALRPATPTPTSPGPAGARRLAMGRVHELRSEEEWAAAVSETTGFGGKGMMVDFSATW